MPYLTPFNAALAGFKAFIKDKNWSSVFLGPPINPVTVQLRAAFAGFDADPRTGDPDAMSKDCNKLRSKHFGMIRKVTPSKVTGSTIGAVNHEFAEAIRKFDGVAIRLIKEFRTSCGLLVDLPENPEDNAAAPPANAAPQTPANPQAAALRTRFENLKQATWPPPHDANKAAFLFKINAALNRSQFDVVNELLSRLEPIISPSPSRPQAAASAVSGDLRAQAAEVRKRHLLDHRVEVLRQKPFPPDMAPMKDVLIKTFFAKVVAGDPTITTMLANCERQVAPFANFFELAGRKDQVSKVVEEAFALTHLHRTGDAGFQKATAELNRKLGTVLSSTVITDASTIPADAPDREARMGALFKQLQDQKETVRQVAEGLRPIFAEQKKKQLRKELEGKDSLSADMANCLGVDSFLDRARMGELMASMLPGRGFDPYDPKKGVDGAPTKAMTLAEVAAIYGYSTQDFATLNAVLRNPPQVSAAVAEKQALSAKEVRKAIKEGTPIPPSPTPDYTAYIDACKQGLAKLPPYTKPVVRGDTSLHPSILEEIISKGTRTEKGFMSSGTATEPVPGFGTVYTRINNIKTGKEITAFSLHQSEGEVLFPPGAVLKFVSFRNLDNTVNVTDYTKLGDLPPDVFTKPCWFEFTQVS